MKQELAQALDITEDEAEELLGYEEADAEEIRETIEKLGQNAQAMAVAIATGLIGPVQAGYTPIVFRGDRYGRVLVAVLPNRLDRPIGGEGDPFEEALRAFSKALKDYGPIGEIGV
jgi:hypothetical protein